MTRNSCAVQSTIPWRRRFAKQLINLLSSNMSAAAETIATTQRGNDDICIRIIRPLERQRVLDFLRIHYYLEEPLTCGSEPKEQDKSDEDFNMSNLEHGTCLLAEIDKGETIVGAVLAGPKGPDEAEHIFEAAAKEGNTKWGKILKFLAGVERDADVYQRFGVKRVLHAHVIGVDARVRGRKIGGRLMGELQALASSLGYELLTSDCTSYYSAQLCERLGWKCVNTAYYRDYLDDNKQQVFRPPQPHECCKTFAIKL